MFFCKNLSRGPFLLYPQQRGDLPPIQRLAAGGDVTLKVSVHNSRLRRHGDPPPGGGGRAGVHRREQKGTGHRMVSCPLLTPLTFLCADTSEMCSEMRGLRGLGSVRRAAYVRPYCPEFPLRSLPRITVRGHSVQGGGGTLRKAPLPSSVCPWSTRRHCGPLAFRRATEGSRVQRRVWGRQEGAREPYGALAPFCLRRETPAPPPPPGGGNPSPPWDTASVASSGAPLYRRNGLPSAEGKKEKALPCGRTIENKVTCSYS